MKERFITSIAILFVVVVMFLSKLILDTSWIFDAFISVIVIIAALEMSGLLKRMGKFNHGVMIWIFPVLYYGLFFLCFQLQLGIVWFVLLTVGLMLLMAIISALISILARRTTINEMRVRGIHTSIFNFAIKKAMHTVFGFVYPTILLMFLVVFNHMDELSYVFGGVSGFNGLLSVVLLAFAFLIPFLADTFAYLTGSLIGGKKLCPNLSAGKTIAGTVGGIVWTGIIMTVLFLIFNADTALTPVFAGLCLAWWHVLLISILGAVACVFGDLFESFLKRRANVKDSSDLLPGHGGVLDRMDSFAFNTPVLFLLFLIFII